MRLLLVENSKTITSMLMTELAKVVDFEVDWASSTKEAIEIIEERGADQFKLAISCLNLPDAPDGQAIAAITEYQIPTIIFSARFEDDLRDQFLKMPGVVDYVVKESHAALKYLCHMVYRLVANREIKALVVDDARAVRVQVAGLLRQYQFQVFEAENGEQALAFLEENRDVKLVISDYYMEPVNGFELTKKIRETYQKEELVIIGLSGADATTLSARFIKVGANDFMTKPFQPEELFCRVSQNMDLVEKTQKLVNAATKDYLTDLFNRRYFFENGPGKLRRAYRQNRSIALAMLDIDHFKSVNDTFGHDVGDEVLKAVAAILKEGARKSDIVARLGGEEFAILVDGLEGDELTNYFENLRQLVENKVFASLQDRKNVTCSFGVVVGNSDDDIDTLVKRADKLLYQSKESGRNRVTLEN